MRYLKSSCAWIFFANAGIFLLAYFFVLNPLRLQYSLSKEKLIHAQQVEQAELQSGGGLEPLKLEVLRIKGYLEKNVQAASAGFDSALSLSHVADYAASLGLSEISISPGKQQLEINAAGAMPKIKSLIQYLFAIDPCVELEGFSLQQAKGKGGFLMQAVLVAVSHKQENKTFNKTLLAEKILSQSAIKNKCFFKGDALRHIKLIAVLGVKLRRHALLMDQAGNVVNAYAGDCLAREQALLMSVGQQQVMLALPGHHKFFLKF